MAILTLAGLFFVYQAWESGGTEPPLTFLNDWIVDASEASPYAGSTKNKLVEQLGSDQNESSEKRAQAFFTQFIDPMAASPDQTILHRIPASVGDYIDPLANNTSNQRKPTAAGSFIDPLELTEKVTQGRLEVGIFIDPDGVEARDSQDLKRISIGAYIDPDNS
ncbi:MAG: hypothetical protein ACFHXK_03825 [bacterium]